MRRILSSAWLIPVLAIGLLAATICTGARATTDARGRTIVVYAHPPCPPELMKLYNPLFDEFRRTHQDIDLQVLHITGNYEDKIKVMLAGGVGPDVIFMYPTAVPAWTELDALEPMKNRLATAKENTDYFKVMLDTFSYEGELYGLPKDASATIIEYNVDMFRKYGVEPPHASWTWDDLVAAAKKLTLDTDGDGRIDQWGMAAPPWPILVWANSGDIIDESGSRCLLQEPKALAALKFYMELRTLHGVTPSVEAEADLGTTRLFQLGRIGMHFGMYPYVSLFRSTCKFEWDLAPMPRGAVGQCTDSVGSAFAINSHSRVKDAAFEFVHWMTSEHGMAHLVTVESPSCVRLAGSSKFLDSEGLPKSKKVAIDAMDYAHTPMHHPKYNEIMDVLGSQIGNACLGRMTMEDALKNAVPRVDAILKRSAKP